MTERDNKQWVSVRKETCIRCGQCEAACPTDVFAWVGDDVETLFPGWCIKCGHCVAACGKKAFIHSQIPLGKFVEIESDIRAPKEELWRLFEQRRSCRRFLEEPLKDGEIEALINTSRYAPTATNAQNVRFLVLSEKAAVEELTRGTAAYYHKLDRQLRNPITRGLISLAVGSKIVEAYRYHMPAIMARFHKTHEGKDQLFYGAPHVIIAYANGLTHMALANCNLAVMQILLAASALELGACYNGYALTALTRERSLRKAVGISRGYVPSAVIAVGHPAAGFYRVPPRRKRRVTLA